MPRFNTLLTILALLAVLGGPTSSVAQNKPLRVEITQGVIEPMPFALAQFVAQNRAAQALARDFSRVIADDLSGTGLFREIPSSSFISKVTSFEAPVSYADWSAINAQALIIGALDVRQGNIVVKFRLFDVISKQPVGQGVQLSGPAQEWRRLAHRVADAVYSRLTGEGGYFDSRVAFISESGPKNRRTKQLAVMDYDGENIQMLTDGRALVLAPRISPDGNTVLFTSYAGGFPRIVMMDLRTRKLSELTPRSGTMTFSPRFSPDGRRVVFSLEHNGNTDLYVLELSSNRVTQLTNAPSIETAPSFSPDGRRIVFESDRSGQPQIYVMSAQGGAAQRISQGAGRYGTPVWSPRGDLIAFTKQHAGRFHIGVMRTDGRDERLLTASFLDEGPSWSPNGRVIMFTRETPGAAGNAHLYSVDITGRNLRRVPVSSAASDPAWSRLRP